MDAVPPGVHRAPCSAPASDGNVTQIHRPPGERAFGGVPRASGNMAGLGYLRDEPQLDEPQQPFAVDLDSTARPARPLWSWFALAAAALAVLVAARPPASSFPAEVSLRRRKRPPQALLQRELRAFAAAPRRALLDKATVSQRWEWPEEPGLWARDLLLISTGCTPKACFVGAAGRWWRAPRWRPRFDLYALFALHSLSLLCSYQAPGLFFAHFAPRVSRPRAPPCPAPLLPPSARCRRPRPPRARASPAQPPRASPPAQTRSCSAPSRASRRGS